MSSWATMGAIVSVLALAGSILFHLFKTTWWMATLTGSLNTLTKSVDNIEKVMARHEAINYTKEDAARDFAVRDEQIKATHRRLDELNHGGKK